MSVYAERRYPEGANTLSADLRDYARRVRYHHPMAAMTMVEAAVELGRLGRIVAEQRAALERIAKGET